MAVDTPAVRVSGVNKRFRIYHEKNSSLKQTLLRRRRSRFESFWAVKDVSFDVPQGTTLGIIGPNGSGKSTLLKCIAGILRPESGVIQVTGRLAALLELGAGFFPEYSGRENIYLNAALLGLPRDYIDEVIGEIIEFASLERFIDNAVKTYSSGMFARLGFSIAVHLDPDVLVVDEILAVGDEAFQRRSLDRIAQMKAQGKTLILVSHAMESIKEICSQAVWMESGEMRAHGSAASVIDQYINRVNETEVLPIGRVGGGRGAVEAAASNITVTAVSVHGPAGPAAVLHTGDPLAVHIDYAASGPLEGVRFEIEIRREDGVLAFQAGVEKEDIVGAILSPAGEVVMRVGSLLLLEGLFRVAVTVRDAGTSEVYASVEESVPFRVLSSHRSERGLTLLGHEWDLPIQSRRAVRPAAPDGG
ncbi:MAG: ABC transporter ATP-binding protein [Candidatus Dormibacteria bacterium]